MNVTKEEVEELLALGDPFLKLRQRLEDELAKTGFAPSATPPGAEPSLPPQVSSMSKDELSDTYDRLIHFYDYLEDRLAQCEVYLQTTKERAETIQAAILLRAVKDKTLSNAEARKAYVQVHPAYQMALQDYLYFRQTYAAQEHRRKKMSKSIERVYREMSMRQQGFPTHMGKDYGGNKAAPRNAKRFFKPITPSWDK